MKKLIVLSSLFSLLFAQSNWNIQNPYPTGANLTALHAISQSSAIIFGYSGTILKTTDSGLTWGNKNTVPATRDGILYSTQFVSSTTGWAVGDDVLKTTDGGDSWTKMNTGITATYQYHYSVQFFGTDTGFIAAADALTKRYILLKTTTGGATWDSTSFLTTDQYIGSLFALNSKKIWIGQRSGGKIWRTTDGGASWTGIVTGAGTQGSNIFFKDSVNGFLTSELGLYSTTDGGTTWTTKSLSGTSNGAFKFLDQNNGWLLGGSNYKTTNGGTTWTAVGKPLTGSLSTGHFLTPSIGWGLGYNTIATTTDGGLTWTNKNSSVATGSCVDVQFFNADTGWVVTNNEFLKTTNGGLLWKKLGTFVSFSAYNFRFMDSQNGWVVGSGMNSAWKTMNGGLSWDPVITGLNKTNYAVSIIDANKIWIAADSGYVIATTDGGTTWAKNLVGTARAITKIWMTDASNGIVTDDKGGIYKTTDGGKTWVNKVAPFATSSSSLFMIDSNNGWVTLNSYVAYKTTDGGNTWSQKSIGFESLRDINFINVNIGFACTNNKTMYGTTDGGTNWTKVSTPGDVNALYFATPSTGYIVGSAGLIARTNNGGGLTAIKNYLSSTVLQKFSLSQNYPNPFNPTTNIEFQIPQNGFVTLKVYDALGREAATLVNEQMNGGSYKTTFDGNGLASGIYFYRLVAGNYSEFKKMNLIK